MIGAGLNDKWKMINDKDGHTENTEIRRKNAVWGVERGGEWGSERVKGEWRKIISRTTWVLCGIFAKQLVIFLKTWEIDLSVSSKMWFVHNCDSFGLSNLIVIVVNIPSYGIERITFVKSITWSSRIHNKQERFLRIESFSMCVYVIFNRTRFGHKTH